MRRSRRSTRTLAGSAAVPATVLIVRVQRVSTLLATRDSDSRPGEGQGGCPIIDAGYRRVERIDVSGAGGAYQRVSSVSAARAPGRSGNASRSWIQPPSSARVWAVMPWPPGSRRA